jgi:hypothetical protein
MVIAVGVFNIVQPRWAEGEKGGEAHKRVGSDEEMVDRAVQKEEERGQGEKPSG